MTKESTNNQEEDDSIKWYHYLMSSMAIILIIAGINNSDNSSTSTSNTLEDIRNVALIACENRLKRGLHDPDSFKRSGNGVLLRDGFHVKETGNKKYTITVAKRFSAINGFGARVQNSYGCEVKIDVIADTWTLTQFIIN